MINPSELRVGSIVDFGATSHIVSGIHGSAVMSYWIKDKDRGDEYRELAEYYNPIPLTEEWLLKFGFVQNKRMLGIVYELGSFQLEKEDIDFWVDGNDEIHIPITTVHQLQNLYFALTGEELTIKQ